MAIVSDNAEKSLNAAFATNDLGICEAIDAAVIVVGITKIARDAGLDRVTLYRAFRLRADRPWIRWSRFCASWVQPNLEGEAPEQIPGNTVVNAFAQSRSADCSPSDSHLEWRHSPRDDIRENGDQENISELAQKTIRSRETLSCVCVSGIPSFSTALSLLNALILRFAVERVRL